MRFFILTAIVCLSSVVQAQETGVSKRIDAAEKAFSGFNFSSIPEAVLFLKRVPNDRGPKPESLYQQGYFMTTGRSQNPNKPAFYYLPYSDITGIRMYDDGDEIQVVVDGPVRIKGSNRLAGRSFIVFDFIPDAESAVKLKNALFYLKEYSIRDFPPAD